MSIRSHAKEELARANFGEVDSIAMLKILDIFFDAFDSGGAVFFASDVLNRLIAGKTLTPLTGEDDEWVDVSDEFYQNCRIGSVFKKKADGRTYDLDHPQGREFTITFPYYPEDAKVSAP